MTEKAIRLYVPGATSDPGVEWAADALTTLAGMCGEFALAVARLVAFLLGSLRAMVVGRL